VATVRIATRGSALALTQARLVAEALERALGARAEIVPVRTEGDRLAEAPLAPLGGKGLFVKELEAALLSGRADLAVHSAKDLPARLAPGTELAALPERGDPRDALAGARLDALRPGARVGTGSLRRRAQLLALRRDLEVVPLRGNVETRLRRRDEIGLDAVVLACAGLERLGLADRIDERLDPERIVPAVGQGTLAVQAREGEALARELGALDHAETRLATEAERAFLVRLAGDCNVPLAAYARVAGGEVALVGVLASPDGARVLRAAARAPLGRAAEAGARAAEELLGRGGDAILRALAPSARARAGAGAER
jgi:hydroxymethylbilane synthase